MVAPPATTRTSISHSCRYRWHAAKMLASPASPSWSHAAATASTYSNPELPRRSSRCRPGAAPATKAGSYDLIGRISTLLPAIAHLGAAHLIPDTYDSLPAASRNEARATVSTARSVESYLNESRAGAAATRQAAVLVDFAGKPLIVVTAGRGNDATWQAAQNKLATLSTNSRHRVVPDATHASLYLDQTHSAAASQAIRDVVEAVRTDQALPPN